MIFNKKEFAQLLIKVIDDNSFNEFGTKHDINPTRISRFTRCLIENPPSKDEIKKIATNDTIYNNMIKACGYTD